MEQIVINGVPISEMMKAYEQRQKHLKCIRECNARRYREDPEYREYVKTRNRQMMREKLGFVPDGVPQKRGRKPKTAVVVDANLCGMTAKN